MSESDWPRYPTVVQDDLSRRLLEIQRDLALVQNTIEAYGRGLEEYLRFIRKDALSAVKVGRQGIAAYVKHTFVRFTDGHHTNLFLPKNSD